MVWYAEDPGLGGHAQKSSKFTKGQRMSGYSFWGDSWPVFLCLSQDAA